MTTPAVFSPYSSALPFFGNKPSHVVAVDDIDRLRAYELYDRMFWNEPGWAKLLRRDDEESKEIYVPSSRQLVEALNRYLAVGYNFTLDPKIGSTGEQETVRTFVQDLFRREKIYSQFANKKRTCLVKGDSLWHITADDSKPAGTKISVKELDPNVYFPIPDPNDANRVIGCHLVDVIKDPQDPDGKKLIAKRQTYRRDSSGSTPVVTSELTFWELDAWDDRTLKAQDLKTLSRPELGEHPAVPLPNIPTIPVYHTRNIDWRRHPFGVSELRGMENAIAAVNQSLTDEDLALVMAGLGMYWTSAGPPEDAEGNESRLDIGPGVVLEVPSGESVGRLSGVASTDPSISHMNFILGQLQQGLGISDIAAGKVDVNVAESGIALALQMWPTLSKNREKEQEILGTEDQFLFDLTNYWMPEFESLGAGANVRVTSLVDDPMPKNRKQRIDEIIQLEGAGLILPEMAIEELTDLGYKFPAGAAAKLLAAQTAKVAATTPPDPYAQQAVNGANGSNGTSSNADAGN